MGETLCDCTVASEATFSPSGGVIRKFRAVEQLLVLVVGKIKRIKKQIDTTYNNYPLWGRTAWPKRDFDTIRVRSQALLAATRGESNSTTVTDAGRICLPVGQFLRHSQRVQAHARHAAKPHRQRSGKCCRRYAAQHAGQRKWRSACCSGCTRISKLAVPVTI